MDWSALSTLGMSPGAANFGGAAQGGGVLGQILKQMQSSTAPPAVPGDGSMGATIGPGTTPPPAPAKPWTPGIGLPKGGLLGIANGSAQPQGLAGLLQHFASPSGPAGAPAGVTNPLAGANAGMIGPPPPSAPMNILPDVQMQNQF